MTFAEPLWLWALLVLPLVAFAEARAWRRDGERVARIVARALWARVVRGSGSRWRVVRLALWLVAAASIVLALARPQWGVVRERVEREGVDVVLVLDTSGSMATPDVPPNRFFQARQALLALVSRLSGDRFGLVAFEGEAYPLVPLTLDADAVGLFLETLEPGAVPSPGSALGQGLARGLSLFVDKDRRNKVLVLVSDGEDLEGEVDEAVKRAHEEGVVVHTVGVGTTAGQPVPDFDREGRAVGFKKDEDGSVVVSRLHPETLQAMAQRTGGRYVQVAGSDTSLTAIASAIEGMEQRTLASEFSYRKKERYQLPLGVALAAMTLALLLPLPPRRHPATVAPAAALVALLLLPAVASAEGGKPLDEVMLRPRRLTEQGRSAYAKGDHPDALGAFQRAAATRPGDPAAAFNLADGLYKNGKFDEAAQSWRALGADARSPLAAGARYNLGNALYEKQDYAGAVQAYKDALRLARNDADTRRNLEMALRALQKQQEQQKKDEQKKGGGGQDEKPKGGGGGQQPQKSEEQKEQERFQKEAGMPKDRAMQLLDALQQNEKAEQKKQLGEKPPQRTWVKDW
jgi:Ca-activated chloride channel family protein